MQLRWRAQRIRTVKSTQVRTIHRVSGTTEADTQLTEVSVRRTVVTDERTTGSRQRSCASGRRR